MEKSASPRLPAEWEPQSGVMLTWPHELSDWAPVLDEVEPVFFQIAEHIARREVLLVVCADAGQSGRIRARLLSTGIPAAHLKFAIAPSNDTWARDHGPLTVMHDGCPRLLDFRFNGWGNKYPAKEDDALSGRLADAGVWGRTAFQSVDLVLEGGSLDSDGMGTLLTTRSCLLHPERNPHLDSGSVEQALAQTLGAQRILWLDHGCLEGDDTDGHIDMLARFTASGALVYQSCNEAGYRCFQSLQQMEQSLQTLCDTSGQPYPLKALPWPAPKYDQDNNRLPASYANFLVINGAVLMPAYRDDADADAQRVLQTCFPDHEIIPIDCLPLIQQHGSLHCLTMQFPVSVDIEQIEVE
jgi:agmatine/peptidylarginine deiminase